MEKANAQHYVPIGGGQSPDESGESGIAVAPARPKLAKPPQFAVILHNDDYTTMEFVIEILRRFFQKTDEAAAQIMLEVHHRGEGVAGIYSHEIAETKVVQVNDHAQSRGYPLKCSIREVS